MIKKTAILTGGVDKNFGNVNGMIHSALISNVETSETEVTIKLDSIILWIGIVPAKSTTRIMLETMSNEALHAQSSVNNTNIIINIIETL